MPEISVAEMVCDWYARAQEFGTGLRDWIVQQQKADTDRWKIDSTPSFVINGQKYAGEMSFDAFRKLIPGA